MVGDEFTTPIDVSSRLFISVGKMTPKIYTNKGGAYTWQLRYYLSISVRLHVGIELCIKRKLKSKGMTTLVQGGVRCAVHKIFLPGTRSVSLGQNLHVSEASAGTPRPNGRRPKGALHPTALIHFSDLTTTMVRGILAPDSEARRQPDSTYHYDIVHTSRPDSNCNN